MKLPREDAKKTLILGIIILLTFSAFVYFLINTPASFMERVIVLVFILFGASIGFVLLLFVIDLIKAFLQYLNIVKNSEDYVVKDTETY